ncbi:MAG: DUF192 domain-containing protein, partial [Flavobacteriaceae bacterium]
PRSFYMKNTQFPLDIIFINGNHKIVSFQENAKPFNEASLTSGYPAKYVLELNSGMVNEWAIKVGDSISYSESAISISTFAIIESDFALYKVRVPSFLKETSTCFISFFSSLQEMKPNAIHTKTKRTNRCFCLKYIINLIW